MNNYLFMTNKGTIKKTKNVAPPRRCVNFKKRKTISQITAFAMVILLAFANFNVNAQNPPPQNFSIVLISSVASWEAPADANPIGYKLFLADSLVAELADTTFNYTLECLLYGTDYTANLIAVYESGESEAVSFSWTSVYLKPVQQPFTQYTPGSNEVQFQLANIQGCDDGSLPDGLISFNIYQDGEFTANVPIAQGDEFVIFIMNTLSLGLTTFCTTAVYDLGNYGLPGETGESVWVCEDVNISLECESPVDLTGEVYWRNYPEHMHGSRVRWHSPASAAVGSGWHHWDSGENSNSIGAPCGECPVEAAIRWEAGMLNNIDCDTIEKIRVFISGSYSDNLIFKVWTGENAAILVYSDTVQVNIYSEWYEHNLNETLIIDQSLEYWIGYEIIINLGGYLSLDEGPAVVNHGDFIRWPPDVEWDNISDFGPDFNANWNIQM